MNNPTEHDIADLRLDAVVRARHADALTQLSPQVQAQLTQRRNAVLRGQVHRPRHGLRYAVAGFATLSALAIGLQFNRPQANRQPTPSVAVAPVTVAAANTTPDPRAAATLLDEDPEFYTWLASSDAAQVAKE